MARTKAISLIQTGSTKVELSELSGLVISNIQKETLAAGLKSQSYTGNPATGSVEYKRFKNSASQAYGTARTAGKGAAITVPPTTVNLDIHREIVEEAAKFDLDTFGVGNIMARRADNHVDTVAAELDADFFAKAKTAGTKLTAKGTTVEDQLEELIQAVETVKNDYVRGVPRNLIRLVLDPVMYGRARNYLDKGTNNANVDTAAEDFRMFHGVRVYSSINLPVAPGTTATRALCMVDGAMAQPVVMYPYQQKQNQQGAVPEKGLRQEEDDGVGPPVKEPVGLSREKQSMEHHKGPLEVQGRQTAHREKDRRQSGRGPEAGTVPQRGGRDQLFPPAHGKQDRQDQRGEDQHPQVQQEEGAHIGEVGGPLRRGRKDPGGKVGAQSQAVIHHLPISPADLLRRQAVPGQLQGGNVGVIEGAAQDGGRHRGGQHQQGRSQSGQDAEEFTGLHGITSKNESADWYHTTDRSGTQGPADGKGADPETGPLLNRIQCWISAGGYGRRRACGHTR